MPGLREESVMCSTRRCTATVHVLMALAMVAVASLDAPAGPVVPDLTGDDARGWEERPIIDSIITLADSHKIAASSSEDLTKRHSAGNWLHEMRASPANDVALFGSVQSNEIDAAPQAAATLGDDPAAAGPAPERTRQPFLIPLNTSLWHGLLALMFAAIAMRSRVVRRLFR